MKLGALSEIFAVPLHGNDAGSLNSLGRRCKKHCGVDVKSLLLVSILGCTGVPVLLHRRFHLLRGEWEHTPERSLSVVIVGWHSKLEARLSTVSASCTRTLVPFIDLRLSLGWVLTHLPSHYHYVWALFGYIAQAIEYTCNCSEFIFQKTGIKPGKTRRFGLTWPYPRLIYAQST